MAESAVTASPFQETVCGMKDERVQVQPMTSPPYKWICFLYIKSAKGKRYFGSGFKIHLPDVDRTAIVTSGHCTYIHGHYAKKIRVEFPGQTPIEVRSDDLYAAPEYIKSKSADHDYGLILLPGPGASDDGFGWSASLKDEELNNRLVTNCGFPGDKPLKTMWITGGNISKYTALRIFYENDTTRGQSGSPVFTWYGGYWTVIGVHSYGGCPNSAPRFTFQMISRFMERMNGLKIKSLRSVAFPDVYVSCDVTGVTKPTPAGGGIVNCQYKPPKSQEGFYIHPVEMTPSLASHGTCKVVIESAHFRNVFVRMDSEGMNQFEDSGGGKVICKAYPPGSYESFIFKEEEKGIYSFRSVQFPNCYIRLDGSKVTSPSASGSIRSDGSKVISPSASRSIRSDGSKVTSPSASGSIRSDGSKVTSLSASGSIRSDGSKVTSPSASGSIRSDGSKVTSPSASGSIRSDGSKVTSPSASGSIRSDGSKVTSLSASGSGIVNCQWYDHDAYETPGPHSLEVFHVANFTPKQEIEPKQDARASQLGSYSRSQDQTQQEIYPKMQSMKLQ